MNPRLVNRLTAPLAAVSVLLLIIAIGAAKYVRDLQASVSGPIANSIKSMLAAQSLEISIREIRAQFDRYLIFLDKAHLDPVPRLKEQTAKALADAEAAATSPEEEELMVQTRKGYEHFFLEYEKYLKDASDKDPLYPKIVHLVDQLLEKEILRHAHNYLEFNRGTLKATSDENQKLTRRITWGLIGLGLFGAIGGMLGGWAIAAAVRRSWHATQERLRLTAERLQQAAHQRTIPSGIDAGPKDPLDQVTVSVSAILNRLHDTEREALRTEQLAWVGQMAAGIAHEIRNPLMAIKVLVQAAAERRGGPALHVRDLQVLEEEIIRLEQIVSGFLDFARPPRPDKRPIDLGQLVRRSADSVHARAELQSVDLRVETPPDGVVLSADPNQLRQVLLNLLFNALDVQPQGGRIRLAVAEREPDAGGGARVELVVADNGSGLPADLGDRIFEPFVSTKESGMGLGLSICRRIVEFHGGTLSAHNSPDGGAEFHILLPREGRSPSEAPEFLADRLAHSPR
jgi:two-component system, NtrC family, sensor histidine kinase HydH